MPKIHKPRRSPKANTSAYKISYRKAAPQSVKTYKALIAVISIAAIMFGFVLMSFQNITRAAYTFSTSWGLDWQDGQFDFPYGIAVDSDGNIYVTDEYQHRVQKFNSSGTFVTKWGSNGSGDGQFSSPSAIATDASSNVYVVDRVNSRIQKFDSSGTFVSKFGSSGSGNGQFSNPLGIDIDSSGNIYVADKDNYRVQVFNSSETFVRSFGSEGTENGQFDTNYGPIGIVVDSNGNAYALQEGNSETGHFVQKFDSDGNFVAGFGSYGSGDGQLLGAAYGITTDSSGNVYIADTTNNRVQKFDSSGAYVSQFGSGGSGNGQFDNIYGIAIDSSGNIYTTGHGNHRVQKFDSSGAYVSQFGNYRNANGQFGLQRGIYFDNNVIFAVDTGNNRIQGFDADGNFLNKIGSAGSGNGQFSNPNGIATDSSGNFYVTDSSNRRVQKFNSSGVYVSQWGSWGSGDGQFDNPNGIETDLSNNIYVVDTNNNRVQKFDSSGNYSSQFGSAGSGDGQFNSPYGIMIDDSGNIYVTDTGNNRVQKFDSSGVYVSQWGSSGSEDGQFSVPYGITIDESGNIYVADSGNHRVQKFSSSGTFIEKWGSYGTSDGQLDTPYGVAVDDSYYVYVSDTNNNRIQKFAPGGIPSSPTTCTTSNVSYVSLSVGWTDNSSDESSFEVYRSLDGSNYTLETTTSANAVSHNVTSLLANQNYWFKVRAVNNAIPSPSYAECSMATTLSYYNFASKFGTVGSGSGQLNNPNDIALSSDGYIYIADTTNYRVQKFDSSGNFVSQFGTQGTGDGQLSAVYGITTSSGNVYVADTSNNRVQKFDSSGAFVSKFGTTGNGNGQFSTVPDLAIDSSGNAYVIDQGNSRIQKFDSSGNYVSQFGTAGSGDGQFNGPQGIMIDSSGNIYVAESTNNRVQKFDSSGNFITKWGSNGTGNGQFSAPLKIFVDSENNIYVADSGNNRIQKFDSSGNFITKWGSGGSEDGQFNYPVGLTIDTSGNPFVLESNGNRVQKFTYVLGGPESPTSCTISNIGTASMTVGWTDNSGDETGFELYRSTDGATYSLVTTTAANTISYDASSLSLNTQYWFRVRATKTGLHSDYYATCSSSYTLAGTPSGAGIFWKVEQAHSPVSTGGTTSGKYPSIAFDGTGEPAITHFQDYSSATPKLIYTKKSGETWSNEPVITYSEPFASNTDAQLALNSNNMPSIATINWTNNIVYIYKWENEWIWDTIEDTGDFSNPAIAVQSNNTPAMAYYSIDNRKVRYAVQTPGTGCFDANWSCEDVGSNALGGAPYSIGGVRQLSLALKSNNSPAVAYCGYNAQDQAEIFYAEKSGGSWTITPLKSSSGLSGNLCQTGSNVKLLFGANDTPMIITTTDTAGPSPNRFFITKNGSDWSYENIGTGNSSNIWISAAKSSDNIPFVLYGETNNSTSLAARTDKLTPRRSCSNGSETWYCQNAADPCATTCSEGIEFADINYNSTYSPVAAYNNGTNGLKIIYREYSNTSSRFIIESASTAYSGAENSANTEYAVKITLDDVSQYVQADGTLGASAVWQTKTGWNGFNGILITGLTPNEYYNAFLYARNGAGTQTNPYSIFFYTLANTPSAPTLTVLGATSEKIVINANGNSVENAEYSILETGSGKYVQADGTLGASAVWQPIDTDPGSWYATNQWITVTGLSPMTAYTFKVITRDATRSSIESTTASATTSIATPSAPTLSAAATRAFNILINTTNPASALYAIKINNTNYVQAGGSLSSAPYYATRTTWGGDSGYTLSNLTSNTDYAVCVIAKDTEENTTECSSSSSTKTLSEGGPPIIIDTGGGGCSANWQTGEWSECKNNEQTRTKTDINKCVTPSTATEKRTCTESVKCAPEWACTAWSKCANNTQIRACGDKNKCGAETGKPKENQTCTPKTECTPVWECGNWSACTDGQQTRACTDKNKCGVETNKPLQTQTCASPKTECAPVWECENWSACTDGQQTRACTDKNKCETTSGKPADLQQCTLGGGGEMEKPLTKEEFQKQIERLRKEITIPTNALTRGEFLAYTVTGLDLENLRQDYIEQCKKDKTKCVAMLDLGAIAKINPDEQYYKELDLANQLGLTAVFSQQDNSELQINAVVTKAEALRALLIAIDLIKPQTCDEIIIEVGGENALMNQKTPFKDVGPGNIGKCWLPKTINAACSAKIIDCKTGMNFESSSYITKSEFDKMIGRIKIYIENKKLKIKLSLDTDKDGLTDIIEKEVYRTNPLKSDTDGDGLNDYEEVIKYRTNPLNPDTDNDTVNDKDEVKKYGTDPLKMDTDGDRFNDNVEIAANTDPLNPQSYPKDTRGVGVSDDWQKKYKIEVTSGMQDSDGDGLPDKLEYQYGTDPLNPDTDGDGLTDGQEVLDLKTNPLKATAKDKVDLKITNIEEGQVIGTSSFYIKGTAKNNSLVQIYIRNEFSREKVMGSAAAAENNIFDIQTEPVKDGKYLLLAKSFDAKTDKTLSSAPINIEINSSLEIEPPVIISLGNTIITDQSKRIETSVVPEIRGKTDFGNEVVVSWKSLISTSALIADTPTGEFIARPPASLEIGEHKVTIYSVRKKDKAMSKPITLAFLVKAGLEQSGISKEEAERAYRLIGFVKKDNIMPIFYKTLWALGGIALIWLIAILYRKYNTYQEYVKNKGGRR